MDNAKPKVAKKRVKILSVVEAVPDKSTPLGGDKDVDEDDDWALVQAGPSLRSELNGGRGQGLMARGIIDGYRMRLFPGSRNSTAGSHNPSNTSGAGGAGSSIPVSPGRSGGRWTLGVGGGRRAMSPSSRIPAERESASRALSRILMSDHAASHTDDEGYAQSQARQHASARSGGHPATTSPGTHPTTTATPERKKSRKASAAPMSSDEGEVRTKANKTKRMKRFTR